MTGRVRSEVGAGELAGESVVRKIIADTIDATFMQRGFNSNRHADAVLAALSVRGLSINSDRSDLLAALKAATVIAEEARKEWDAAPSGMRAGKILIALAGGCPGYRPDTDMIHAIIAKAEGH